MNRALLAPSLLFIALVAGGCKKETPSTEAPTEVAREAAPAPRTALAQAEPPVDPAKVPTEEDFEQEVAMNISSKNLTDELDKLEREIQGP